MFFDNENKPDRLTLYGTYSSNVSGFCWLHKVNLTTKQIKQRKCCQKGCNYLIKNEEHGYWKEKARIKELRKKKKEAARLAEAERQKRINGGN